MIEHPVLSTSFTIFAVDESHDYVHFLTPYENEDKLPLMLEYLKVLFCVGDCIVDEK